jgi:hypothetical protein
MEVTQFDDMAKMLGSRKTRRLTLGALLGGALSALGLAEAEAAKSGKCKRQPGECESCKKGRCKKQNGKKKCRAGKILPKANGTSCSVGTCQSGTCVTTGGGGGDGGDGDGGGGGQGTCPVCRVRQGGICVNAPAGTTCNGTGKCNGSGTCTPAPNCTPKTGACQIHAVCCSDHCSLIDGICGRSELGEPCLTNADCNMGFQFLAFCGANFTCQSVLDT